jgi:hypothetical protein
MISIAQTVRHAARNLSAALMLLALGAHPSFAQMIPLSCGSSDTARLWAPRKGISVPLALEGYCICQCRKDWMHDLSVAPAGSLPALGKKFGACTTNCVNVFEATRQR